MGKFLSMVVLALCCASLFVSCDSGGTSDGVEFLEVTIDGKTTTTVLDVISVSGDGEFNFIQSCDVEGVNFMLTAYSNLDKLAASSIGEYRFCPSGEPQNLDFEISVYNENYDYAHCKDGEHTVTSIKRSVEGIAVEGVFKGTLHDNRNISGKYRLLVW